MSDNVCTCRCCVDPRENGFYEQHGLPTFNGIYSTRPKGSFVPKPNITNDISTTCAMLRTLGKKPMTIQQGHRDCAAVRVFYASADKSAMDLDNTDREFIRNFGAALKSVIEHASSLKPEDQLQILEKACVLQSINNLHEFPQLATTGDYELIAYAYYSLSPYKSDPQPTHGSQIPLMIYDPTQGVFARAVEGNQNIRIVDLVDLKSFRPKADDQFQITQPLDLDVFVLNEVRFALAGIVAQVGEQRTDATRGPLRIVNRQRSP